MAKKIGEQTFTKSKKKTKLGKSNNTKTHNKGGGLKGSTKSKNYKKKYRGQGR
tara:strand:+ start:84 stop:242 length:159 start_codon:yes stop_codon:yes gene_type:complete